MSRCWKHLYIKQLHYVSAPSKESHMRKIQ